MKTKRRSFAIALLYVVVAASASAASPSRDTESAYPAKPIRWIEPFAPGGGSDIIARALAQRLTEIWGQSIVVDNRSGASGNIGVDIVAKAAPDGYTIGNITATHSVNPSVNALVPYDLLRDLQPVVQMTSQPYMLVAHPAVAASNVQQLIALAKSRPGQINYGSSGTGGLSHLSGALLSMLANVQMTHVPYKGGAPALTDVMGGQIQILFATVLSSLPHVKGNRLKYLAVSSAKRVRALPDVPSIAESGVPGFDVTGWYGIVAPAKVPKAIIGKLNSEIAKLLHAPEIRDRVLADGAEPIGGPPEQFWTHVASEVQKWRKVAKAANVKAE